VMHSAHVCALLMQAHNGHAQVDMRIGTGVDNFKSRVQSKRSTSEPYILLNTPAQNAVATAEWYVCMLARVRVTLLAQQSNLSTSFTRTQSAVFDGLAPALFRQATSDVLSGKWLSHNLSDPLNPHKAEAGELQGMFRLALVFTFKRVHVMNSQMPAFVINCRQDHCCAGDGKHRARCRSEVRSKHGLPFSRFPTAHSQTDGKTPTVLTFAG
jgi:hypothetical protein